MKAENNVWKFVKADVYKVSYNVFIEQWLKERTSEIKVLNVSINEETGRAKLLFENASNSIVMFGLMDLSYYRIYSNHRKEELVNDENVISVGYVDSIGEAVPSYRSKRYHCSTRSGTIVALEVVPSISLEAVPRKIRVCQFINLVSSRQK